MPVRPATLSAEAVLAARERVCVGPVPSWAITSEFDPKLPVQPGDQWTQLLTSVQIHAELRQEHVHAAVRLEAMQAVTHISQWRLRFDPQTESVVVHWMRIRRGEEQFDYTQIDRFQLLQREESLESLAVDGRFTLLLILEDVRVGDFLETCFTVERTPRLLPEHSSALFQLRSGVAIGKFYFSMRCSESRPMKWKASRVDLQPARSWGNGEDAWVWAGERYVGPKPEPNIPDWYSEGDWMHFSDLSEWPTVSAAIDQAWRDNAENPALDELVKEITGSETDLLLRAEKVIRFVQDDLRYLSVNWESGGQIPTDPIRVARRRFGDCKDVSWLLVHLLQHLGIPARPILVNTFLRKAVREMLPTTHLFNHAIVEYEVQEQRCWVDVVAKQQGGGPLQRVIVNYGAGLAVADSGGGLVEPPSVASGSSLYEIKETLFLDTTGAPSILAVLVTANGPHAERLRHQFADQRREDIEKDRLQICANRFMNAQRSGPMEIRDDRDANQFLIAEVFEVNGFLLASPAGVCAYFLFRSTLPSAFCSCLTKASGAVPLRCGIRATSFTALR